MMRSFVERNLRGIRGRLLLGMVSIVILFSLISTAATVYVMHRQSLQSYHLLSNNMSAYFVRHLSTIWREVGTAEAIKAANEIFSSEHVLSGALYDTRMNRLASFRRMDFGPQPAFDSLRSTLAAKPDTATFIVRVGVVKRALAHLRPIYEYIGDSGEGVRQYGRLLGFLEINYDLEFARAQRLEIYKVNLLLLVGFVIAGSLVAYVFSRQINRPLKRLVTGVQQFRAGHLDHRVDTSVGGELGKLARSFNKMAIELQQRTDALQRSESRHRLLIQDAKDGIFVVDGSLRFVEVNDQFCELAGLRPDEAAGMPMSEVILSNRENDREIRDIFERKYFHGEVQIQRKDHRRVYVDLHASPLAGDLYMGIARDITERRRYEAELRRAAQLRDLMLRTMSEGLVLVNLDAQIIMANEAAQAIFGNDFEELKHKTFMQCGWDMLTADGEYLEYSRNPVIIALRGRAHVTDCRVRIRRAGTEKFLQINAAPLADDRHNLWGAVVTVRDITATRQTELARAVIQEQLRQHEKLASLGEMAAGVAHEINNPVTGIINYAQFLLDREIGGEEDRALLRSIAEEGNRIAGIVRNLLTFARQEKQDHAATRLDDILEASLHLLGRTLKNDGIRVVCEVPDNLPNLFCRGSQIQQVFINLLSNARDALNEKYQGEHPEKLLRISASEIEKRGQKMVRTEFYDNGIGIAPEILPKIFDPFFTTKGFRNGTGLGLSVTYGIIREHQGEIYVDSVPGEHTSFTVELPAAINGGA
jgi:PAS domain S-box-containing protein